MRAWSPILLSIALFVSRPAAAENLIPGPGDPGFDVDLAAKADGFSLQLEQLHTVPIGFAVDAKVTDPATRALIDAFFASGERDFRAFSDVHPYAIVEDYGDYHHAAIFGGTQIAGDAFRYAVLRDSGAPAAEVDHARAVYVQNLDPLDWMVRVTGTPGVVARGIRRVVPQDGAPALPGEIPETLPIFDGSGAPNPAIKQPTWREDQSGALPFLIWVDDASRDTLVGYVFAMGVAYDVGKSDPTIPEDKLLRLEQHARDIGLRLLEEVDVGGEEDIDMVIRDADGRPTTYHALSAEEIFEGLVAVEGSSGFNAIMGVGILRTLYHVSGEPRLWARYQALIGARDFLGVMERSLTDTLYFDEITNYSVVNMAFMASYGALRYENDPVVAKRLRQILANQMYDAGVDRDARGLGLSFFDFIFAGFGTSGTEGIGAEALDDGLETLRGHRSAPYWEDWHENCDADEIAALDCVLTDGTRVTLSGRRGYAGERIVATVPIPIAARPPSDFMWRADPHGVNGGGRPRLNAGADFYGAYWMGRFLVASTSGLDNISPLARGEPDSVEAEGCSCSSVPETTRPHILWSVLLLFAGALRRR